MRGSLFGHTPYLFFLKTSTFGLICGVGATSAFAYLDLLQGTVLIIMAVMFAFGNGAANGTIGGFIVVEHGYTLL
jgi:hypothetical protein